MAKIKDFSPISQDRYIVAIMKYKRNCLDDVKNADLERAIFTHHANNEWASLPGDQYGQGGVNIKSVKEHFEKYVADELAGNSDLAVPVGGLDDLIK
ncbi:hypothetical protein [Burkholderia semiarida]|uniref:hypothetical protein n=1 Tax=Burkholderia semiarida TaxID=2843303 RepID=UPI0023DD874D|nr:hypothetical protein [Burkholderia semiarida]MDF3092142.1 hypothetical protein [Burkholderia semiarida]MDF3107674.1 hypothetical protein [Burkholderia semiarida]